MCGVDPRLDEVDEHGQSSALDDLRSKGGRPAPSGRGRCQGAELSRVAVRTSLLGRGSIRLHKTGRRETLLHQNRGQRGAPPLSSPPFTHLPFALASFSAPRLPPLLNLRCPSLPSLPPLPPAHHSPALCLGVLLRPRRRGPDLGDRIGQRRALARVRPARHYGPAELRCNLQEGNGGSVSIIGPEMIVDGPVSVQWATNPAIG